MEKYEIQLSKLPPEVIPISSDDEAPKCSLPTTPKSNSPSPSNSSLAPSAPLQARSLEAIGLAYYRTLSIYSQGRKSTYSSQKRYHRRILLLWALNLLILMFFNDSMADQSDYNTSDEEAELDSSLDTDQMDFLGGGTQDSISNDSQIKIRNRGFACLHPVPAEYPNKELVEIFHRMQHFRELDGWSIFLMLSILILVPAHSSNTNFFMSTGDIFNAKAYRAAVVALKCYPEPLTHVRQIRDIRGIGDKLGRMIQDFIQDGKIADYGMVLLLFIFQCYHYLFSCRMFLVVVFHSILTP